MDVNVSKAMAAEHTMSEDSEEAFEAPNTQLSTTPLQEWRFVLGMGGHVSANGEIVEGGRPTNEVLFKGRNAKSLEHLKGLIEAREAELTMAELVALRLYTGPMYVRYNGVLRGFYSRNLYTTTLHLIVSGLRKLCRITAPPPKNAEGGREVFRGTGGMALPPDFFHSDEQGFAGGVEAAFMSTTTDRTVAMHYSGVGGGAESEGGLRTVFRYLVGEREECR
ncbi:hypothetical protein T484DRAFT_2393332 [Baffinella frigidus]|nr:hypothetical protein T484DRAFT_2393332 [Cryptophyta sp. CCMP2293]